jgi:aminoglycoside 2''-phosphotransferase
MDLQRYRQVLEQCFPELTVTSIKFVGGGTFRVFEVNGDRACGRGLVFRFPHGGAGGNLLRREQRLCNVLGPLLPLPIPHYEYFSEGCPLFNQPVGGYSKLNGVPLQECTFDQSTLRQVATQLGGFLSALHSTPPEAVQGVGLPSVNPPRLRESQHALYARVQRYAFPLMSTEERRWTQGLFELFLADTANWQFRPVLVHGDFDSSNILCDPDSGRVVGIIDFEEACPSDPALDFCVLKAEYGSGFLQDLLEAYHRLLDECFIQRVRFHSRRILFHEMLYGIRENAQPFVDHGLARLRRAMTGLEPIGGWLAASTSETRSREGYPA